VHLQLAAQAKRGNSEQWFPLDARFLTIFCHHHPSFSQSFATAARFLTIFCHRCPFPHFAFVSQAKFGNSGVAQYQLEIYTTAVLQASIRPPNPPKHQVCI
jgi:hypothetical protein